MRCKTCDYPLWNLKTRACPECGTAYLPSQQEFVPSSVQFCCQHCDQSYYGIGDKGHLVPSKFECVSCHTTIDMDEMVLRPTSGVEEQQTRVYSVPWHDRRTNGLLKSWFRTCVQAMGGPGRLAETTVQLERTRDAWVFAVLTCAAASFFGVFAVGLIIALFQTMGSSAQWTGIILTGFALGALGLFVGLLVIIGLWGAVTHGMLAITGGAPRSIRRTYEAICYSTGICAFLVVPGIGPYCGGYTGFVPIWWTVSSVLMVWKAQGVHGGRATLATLTFPIAAVGLLVLATLVLFVSTVSTSRSSVTLGPLTTQTESLLVLDAITDYALANNGVGPAHGIELIVDGSLRPRHFRSVMSATSPTNIPVAGTYLRAFARQTSQSQQAADVQTEINKLPANVVAHRVGDFVFTHHGIDLNAQHRGLWLVVMCEDPDAMLAAGWGPMIDPVEVGMDDGSISLVPRSSMPAALAAQNVLRSNNGLAPLPDPLSITHVKPAGGGGS